MNLEKLTDSAEITPTKLTKREYALGIATLSWEITKYGLIPLGLGYLMFGWPGAGIAGFLGCIAQEEDYGINPIDSCDANLNP
jgi:hypothetical protein